MDDNSNLETVNVIKKYTQDPRIQYFNSNIKHKNRCKATRYANLINIALKDAQGIFVSYLTDDTVYLPERLKSMSKYFFNI